MISVGFSLKSSPVDYGYSNKIIIKFIVSILLAYLMVYIIDSLLSNSNLSQPGIDHIVILDFIFASCIVIIALIIIFGFLILNKHK